jgi:hypothetical protein
MRTEQVKVEIFKFDELSEEAKEKVLCNFRYGDYYDCNGVNQEIEDMITLKIAEYGFSKFNEDAVIEFSLGYCQGDGVAFYGYVDFDTWIANHKDNFTPKEIARLNWINDTIGMKMKTVRNSFGYQYSHARTMNVELLEHDYDIENYRGAKELNEVLNRAQIIFRDEIRALSHECEKLGYEVLERYQSEEYIKETIEANDYEFLANGKIYH